MPDSLCKDAFRRSLSAILQPGYLLPSHLPDFITFATRRCFFCNVSRRVFRKIFQYFIMLFHSYHPDPVSKQRFLYPVSFHRVPAAVHYIFPDSPGCPSHPQTFCQDFDLRFSSTTFATGRMDISESAVVFFSSARILSSS